MTLTELDRDQLERARAYLSQAGLSERCRFEAGDGLLALERARSRNRSDLFRSHQVGLPARARDRAAKIARWRTDRRQRRALGRLGGARRAGRVDHRPPGIPPPDPRLGGPRLDGDSPRRRRLADVEALSESGSPVRAPDAAEIKVKAAALGFDLCGIARAHAIDRSAYDRWYANHWDANISHMRTRLEERLDPRVLLPGARSVIALAASYGPARENVPRGTFSTREQTPDRSISAAPGTGERDSQTLSVARYAQGRDYHNGLLKRARKLAAWLRAAGAQVYAEVDAGAVAEKFWAMEAGLGWIGKNGLVIHEKFGSWLLLGALVTDLDLAADAPYPDRCGDCSACIPACPTDAIQDGRLIDANRCLAFHTIESKKPIPTELSSRAGGRVFGCDACQEACPWNRRAREGTLVELRPRPAQRALALEQLLALTDEEAKAKFAGTPLMRAGREGLVRSALAVCRKPLEGNSRELAEKLRDDASESIRIEAARALDAG